MIGNSVRLPVKRGKPGKHCVNWLYEREGETELEIPRKMSGRELLQIGVGPQGVGPGTFAFVLYPNTIPNDVYPVAEINFAAKSPGQKPIKRKYTLKQRC